MKPLTHFFENAQKSNLPDADLSELDEISIDQAIICLEEQLQKSSLSPTGLPAIDSSELSTATSSTTSLNGSNLADNYLTDANMTNEEHIITINECPLCQQPRLYRRSEVDIVTHLATCAGQDWRKVDSLIMRAFVTSSQAHRKWYSKVIGKITWGDYKLGANSANILVQDRLTGLIEEERMSVYVRLGIRLLYRGLRNGTMERQRMQRLLRSLSLKQGRKFDSPNSVREIRSFIAFHKLNMDEVLLGVSDFKNFNEFFYRKLKPSARPCCDVENRSIAVSPADSRCVVFNTTTKATELWIKGREFSIERLIARSDPSYANQFEGGGLAVFRLAPQDYHRFHVPVDGTIGEITAIEGQYYTVNPMAIRSTLDVYGENVRVIVPIQSPIFGLVMVVCIGAMMVGSTIITVEEGQEVKRTDELGYFKFGSYHQRHQ